MLLSDIAKFQRGQLRKADITVTRRDGTKYKERILDDGVQLHKLDDSRFVVYLRFVREDVEAKIPLEVESKKQTIVELRKSIVQKILQNDKEFQIGIESKILTPTEEQSTLEQLDIKFMSVIDVIGSGLTSPRIEQEFEIATQKMPLFVELPIYRYSSESEKWVVYPSYKKDIPNVKEIKMISYNVWFEKFYRSERITALLKMFEHMNSDIICLQEVLPEFIQSVISQKWIQDSYYISDIDGSTVNTYGVMILSKFPVCMLKQYTLPTQMSRRLLVAEYNINGEKMKIGTVHLESMEFSDMRLQQLKQITKVLAVGNHALLMGDTNICATTPENANIPTVFTDFWPLLQGSNTNGFTCGIAYAEDAPHPIRIDRIFYRNNTGKEPSPWKPTFIQLLGTDPFMTSPEGVKVYPSDHFGLFGKLSYQ